MSYRLTEGERKHFAAIKDTVLEISKDKINPNLLWITLDDGDKLGTRPVNEGPTTKKLTELSLTQSISSNTLFLKDVVNRTEATINDYGWRFRISGIFDEDDYLSKIQLIRINDTDFDLGNHWKGDDYSDGRTAVISGSIDITKILNLDIKNGLNVYGNTYLSEEVTVDGQTILNDLLVRGVLEVISGVTFYDTLNVYGQVNFYSGLTVQKETVINSTLWVIDRIQAMSGITIYNGDLIMENANIQAENIYTAGDVTVGGDLYTEGDTHLHGNLVIDESTYISGDTYISGKLIVSGEAHLQDSLTIDQNTYTSGNNYISGDTIIQGNTVIHSNLQVDETAYISGDTFISGNSYVNQELHASGDTHLYNNLNVGGDNYTSGNTYISGNTTISGDTHIESNLLVDQNTYVSGDTYISGDTVIYNNLTVSGASQFSGDVYFENNIWISGDLYASGNMHIPDDFDVDGVLTANKLVVNKSSYLSGSTYISGDLHLSYPDNYDLSDTDVVNKQYLDDEHRLVEIIDHPDRSIIEDKIEYDEILYWSTLPIAGNWNSIAYGNDRFVAVGRGPTDKAAIGVMTRHGLKWQEVTMPNLSNWQSVTFGNGQFVAITDSRTVAYSSDGISWTETGMRVSASWQDIVWGNGIYVAIASNSHDKAAYSPDGTNWKESVLPTTPNNANWYSVAFGNGRFIAVAGDYLKGAASTDGINWTEVNMPIAAGWIDVSFGNGKFVALAHGNDNKAAYSSDGISWTETVLPNSANWQSVTFGDNGSFPGDKKFVAVAFSNDKFAFSKDGITWESGTLPANESWVSVTFGSREFVAISNSPNGPYYGMSVKFNDIIPDLFIKTKMIAEKNVTVPKLEDDLNLTEKYVRVETPPLPTITHTILQTYQTEHPSTDMDQAVNLEFVLKSLDNLYKEILNPSVPNGIVYIDGRADAGGKQTITATKDVPTPVI